MLSLIAALVISQAVQPCVRPEDFRQATDGIDWTPAIHRAINSFASTWGPSTPDLYGGCVQLGFGQYNLLTTLTLDKSVSLQGTVSGGAWGGTRLACGVAASPCIVVTSPWVQIRDITLDGATQGKASVSNGIEMRARARLEHMYIQKFGGHCVYVNGGSGYNVNGWSVEHSRIVSCGQDGIHVVGANGNAGMALFDDLAEINGIAINDLSFLGNSYFANQVATCKGGSYSCALGNQRCVFVSNYVESDTPCPTITNPSMWVGGLVGACGQYLPMNGSGIRDGIMTARDLHLGPYQQRVQYLSVVPTSTAGYQMGDTVVIAYPGMGDCSAWRVTQFPSLGTHWKCVARVDDGWKTQTRYLPSPPTTTAGYSVGDTVILSKPVPGQCDRWRLVSVSGVLTWKCGGTVSQ